jgi:hypothetical protein
MKTIASYCFVLMCISLRMSAGQMPKDDRADHPRVEQQDDKVKRVIAQLEGIKIDDVAFAQLTTSQAMNYLTKEIVGENGGGVIHFVIRGADQTHKITIKRKNLNFAQAIDDICRQTGRVWMIDFDDRSGRPVLVIKDKNG